MSKLYVPEGVWLVCSEGTSTQQLTVLSQSKVKIDGGHLMATTEDKVKNDFGCKKNALIKSMIGAVAMLLVAFAIVAVTVGTGGLGVCAIIGAAGAAGAVGGGIIGRLMPCGCAMNMNSWENHSTSVMIGGYKALLEDSVAPCTQGGIIKIMYSKEAAEAYAALVAAKSNVDIANLAVIAFCTPFIIRGALQAFVGFKGGLMAALEINKLSAAAFVAETAVVGGIGYGAGKVTDAVKSGMYSLAGVNDYVEGERETDANKLLYTSANPDEVQTVYDTQEKVDNISHIGERESSAITDYERLSYQNRGYLGMRETNIQESGWEVVETERTNSIIRIQGERTTEVISDVDNFTDREGTYYMSEEYRSITGKDYNVGRNIIKDVKDAVNPFKDKDSRAMFALGLFKDVSRGIANKLLEGSIDNYKSELSSEQSERDKLKVKTK